MDEMMKRLRAARGEAVPGSDLWPGVEARIRTPRGAGWQRAAAALVLFAAGAFAGVLGERMRAAHPGGSSSGDEARSALHAAADVQRAGSEYVAAVARVRSLDGAQDAVRIQAYEAALAALSVTAQEITAALDLRAHHALVGTARGAHDAVSRRTTALLQRVSE